MYESNLVEPSEAKGFLDLCNKENYEIISTTYVSSSEHILFIIKRPRKAVNLNQKAVEEE